MPHTSVLARTPILACVAVVCFVVACSGEQSPRECCESADNSAKPVQSDAGCEGFWCPPPPDCGTGEPCPDAGESYVTVQNLGATGLYTSPSFLTSAPPGAALQAENLVVDKPGEYTTRRGFERLPAAIPGGYHIGAWTVYQGAIVAHAPETSTLYRYVSGVWTAYSGTYAAPSPGLDSNGNPLDGRIEFFETQQALYFTTAQGIYRLESVTGTPQAAGAVQALPGVATITHAGQALTASHTTAYRYVWGRRAANGRIMLGAPSGRVTISNRSESFTFAPSAAVRAVSGVVTLTVTSGVAGNVFVGQIINLTATGGGADATNFPTGNKTITGVGATTVQYLEASGSPATAAAPGSLSFTTVATDVKVNHTIPIPSGVDDSYFLQVYRADEVPLNTDPSDEMFLVHEKARSEMPTAATSYAFTDDTPDAFKADALYTNANAGGGIGFAHYTPPKASAAIVFQDRAFYGNVELVERIALTVLAVGPGGLDIDMGIEVQTGATINTYIGGSSESGSTFKVFTDGTPAQNIANTVQSLVRVINNTSGGLVFARYTSDSGSINPGQFLLESRSVGSSALTVRALQKSDFITPALSYRVTVANMVRASNVTTVTTPPGFPHGFIAGQQVRRVAGGTIDPAFLPGTFTVASVIDAFNFTIADPGANAPTPPDPSPSDYFFYTTVAEVQTDDEAAPGGWMVSDNANPDSVPAVLPEIVGDRYKRILFMVQVGNTLFFGKEDGLFRLIGTDPTNFTTDCVDPTVRFVSPRAVWVLNGRAYALTSQGLASWTESTQPVATGLPIEDILRNAVENFPNLVSEYSFAVSHESKRRAYLWLPDADGNANALVYVLNATTGEVWTRWAKPALAALIHPTEDRLWIAPPDEDGTGTAPAPAHERNTGTAADYQDEDGQAIQATLQWVPQRPPDTTQQEQVVRTVYNFAGGTPTQVEVAYSTNWVPTPLWFTLDASSSQSPGTFSTVPDWEHSRGDFHSLLIRHGIVQQPLRVLGYSAFTRYWQRGIP